MPGIIKVPDGCHCFTSETTSTSLRSSDAEYAWNAGKNQGLVLKCQKFTVAVAAAVVVVIVALITVTISLAVLSTKPYLPCLPIESAACPDSWIGYRRKCFYVSKEERNWSLSLNTCSSLNASLAVFDTQKELDFWVEIFSPLHYWFGLSREISQVWKWFDGTEFKNHGSPHNQKALTVTKAS
ncbi:PREDICTED: early activation antigen CD69-like isoform X2 [Thamnophis sirtalis]|uniref:Early activation antigen CD69-like isoform X2 n=1 Tax=Thamnophis sirtalis TaxID=35019 RepID=A0A6I9YCN4_9SAUR|nr:PREDICTED: early activation antigen CD69-like isoform X2 [Thamnophis sirtalis]